NPEFNEEYYYEPYERYEYRYNKEEKKVKKDVKGGGAILIGPIPIVFGESRYAVYALMLAILLMMLSILFILAARL
ncbi:MAG TPA: DUF131 domain-containing protein, partial [Archaeoglobaceae archaeon]|nr:DUF131 domain-containing protein [Archaeoglobaceae archaeon]